MFEKDAEEYVNKDAWLFETARQDAKHHFQKGAEFGYNKGKMELDKAIEIIEGLMRFCRCFAQHHTDDVRYKDAEQLLKERI